MSKHKTILSSFLGKAYKFPADELSALIDKPDEELVEADILKVLLDKDAEKVNALRTRLFAEGAKKAEANAKKAFMEKLHTVFEIDDDGDDDGEDGVFEKIKTKLSKPGGKGGQLTDEDVKKHPLYLKAEGDYKKTLANLKKEYDDKVVGIEKGFARKEVGGKVARKASDIFLGLNPVLSPDQSKAANQASNFVNRFAAMDWEEADGEFYLIENDKRKEDQHGHAIGLTTFVKTEAEKIFDFKKAEERRGAGEHYNGNGKEKPGEKKPQPYTGKLPGTETEYLAMMNDRTIPLPDRKAIQTHWEDKVKAPA